MSRRVIVTRPAHEASRWLDALQAAGFAAVALPLIAIEALDDRQALEAARRQAGNQQALMFVSAAAVSHFMDAGAAPALARSATRCWATGPGTVRALREAGVPEDRIDAPPEGAASFDSEALWSVVHSQVGAGSRVMIVRGGDADGRPTGRDWLVRQIEAAGGEPSAVASYRRCVPAFGEDERRLAAQAAGDGSLWLFSSSEGIANLCRAMPALDWHGAFAIATHPRIGEAARAAGFGRVTLSPPGLAALVASIESFA
ncbi:uroporphyrinogen-III synthase [Variovorax sp. ZT4R33]|uniref:uroporphyrinogen-III synthase n=1 Tax=Variovorax sp. ZT4R33 TaxID=3443743 RepID=UPI003F478E20